MKAPWLSESVGLVDRDGVSLQRAATVRFLTALPPL